MKILQSTVLCLVFNVCVLFVCLISTILSPFFSWCVYIFNTHSEEGFVITTIFWFKQNSSYGVPEDFFLIRIGLIVAWWAAVVWVIAHLAEKLRCAVTLLMEYNGRLGLRLELGLGALVKLYAFAHIVTCIWRQIWSSMAMYILPLRFNSVTYRWGYSLFQALKGQMSVVSFVAKVVGEDASQSRFPWVMSEKFGEPRSLLFTDCWMYSSYWVSDFFSSSHTCCCSHCLDILVQARELNEGAPGKLVLPCLSWMINGCWLEKCCHLKFDFTFTTPRCCL